MSTKNNLCQNLLKSVAVLVAVSIGIGSVAAKENKTPPAPPLQVGKNNIQLKYSSMSGDLNKKGAKQGEVTWTEWWYAKKEVDWVHLHAVGMITVVMEDPSYFTGADLDFLYPELRHFNKGCRYEGSAPDENGKGLKLKLAVNSDKKATLSASGVVMEDGLDIDEVNVDSKRVLWKLSPSGATTGRLDKIVFTAEWKCPVNINLDRQYLGGSLFMDVDDNWISDTSYHVDPNMGKIHSTPDGNIDETKAESFERCVMRYSPKRKRWCGGIFPPTPEPSYEESPIIDPDSISKIRRGLNKPTSTAGILGSTGYRNDAGRVLDRQLTETAAYTDSNRARSGSPASPTSRDVLSMSSRPTIPASGEAEQPISRGMIMLGRGPSTMVVDRTAIRRRGNNRQDTDTIIASNPTLVPGPTRASSVGAVSTGRVSLPSPGGNATLAIPNRRPVARPAIPINGNLQVSRGVNQNGVRLAVPSQNLKRDQNSSGLSSNILTDPSFDQ